MQAPYDFIIVGGGSAGSVLANRLSVDPGVRVLVLEAGRPDHKWDVLIHMPAALPFPMGRAFYDWRHQTEPEPFLRGRRLKVPAGRLLGGTSSMNGMIFQRGNPLDYERWAADPGMDNWDYAHVLPYFRRSEDSLTDTPFRGRGGPITLERGRAANPLFGAFLQATEQAGYPTTEDVNGQRQEGFGRFDRNIRGTRRWSAARAYLHPAMGRPNLEVRTGANVTRVLFDGTRAIGVEYTDRHGNREQVMGGETVVCGGTVKSPQILQLSGIGDADRLGALGVPVVHHLPGVGENLQDHLEVMVQHVCTQPVSLGPTSSLKNAPSIGFQWLFLKSGPGATNHFEAGGFVRSNPDVTYPNVMFQFLPIASRSYESSPTDRHGYQLHVGPVSSDARGYVRIRSANPTATPSIRFNFLSTEQDRREWIESVRIAREILSQPAFAQFDGGEAAPGPAVRTDDEVLAWVAEHAVSAMHYASTCRMGTNDDSVVDPSSMRVHGTEGLRVVDASVMPYVTNANTFSPVAMIAEKASDLILGRTPLAPQYEQFHRHTPAQVGTTSVS
ncbi:choline dehydrogenase [Pseudonocardia alaniniphila]|uniref:Choline dehydrogenase n=1 Tax=Pseudonocardia alaniniphila TaxID=75291 RepID=A0ABS9TMC3_9PSEU|nr:choline dehydrogenase [Pseudonocardia alaniniphila]MCH6169687.1 choline dehydrogenase [Pseudonocardia alaniniphila]